MADAVPASDLQSHELHVEVSAPREETVAWGEVGPVLDDALDGLGEQDRRAILLRYFGNRPYSEVGRCLSLSENAARMRVERALEKLHGVLARRGITSSSAAVAAALTGNAVLAAPSGVALASASVAATVAAGTGLGWIAFMSTSKLPMALSAAVLLGGAAFVGVQGHSAQMSAEEIAQLNAQNGSIPALESRNKALSAGASQASSLADQAAQIGILKGQITDLEAKAAAAAAEARKKIARNSKPDDGQPVFDISKLDKLPAMLMQRRPEYPPQMRDAGASGEVMVDFVVGSNGAVYDAVAVHSSQREFEAPAVQAVSQWVFKPGQVGGQDVYTHMQVPIVFQLSSDPPPPPAAGSWF